MTLGNSGKLIKVAELKYFQLSLRILKILYHIRDIYRINPKFRIGDFKLEQDALQGAA